MSSIVLPAKRHKYGAKPTVVDGIRFHSQAEARRYSELKLLEKAGEVKRVEVQPRFDLHTMNWSVRARLQRVARRIRSKGRDTVYMSDRVKVGTYVADFRYWRKGLSASENDHWDVITEDVKGMVTPLARWKIRHCEAEYGIVVEVVK